MAEVRLDLVRKAPLVTAPLRTRKRKSARFRPDTIAASRASKAGSVDGENRGAISGIGIAHPQGWFPFLGMTPPPVCITTPRLMIRCWQPEDALPLRDAIASSLSHLIPWLPWAASEPSDTDAIRRRIVKFAGDFRDGIDFIYGIFDRDRNEVLGGTGLHPRSGPHDREIGYWLRASATGRGLVTESTQALTTAAFSSWPELQTVTIVCDPANVRSAAVPRRLGFPCLGTFPANSSAPGRTLDQIWQVTRGLWMEKSRVGRSTSREP